MQFKLGDLVSVVHETIEGKVIRVESNEIAIEDLDGFNRIYRPTELSLKKSYSDYGLTEDIVEKEIEAKIKSLIPESQAIKKFEIDLHIEELLDDHSFMTNHEILTKQMNSCRQFIQRAITANMNRVVIIHGKGEGVLKSEIISYLSKLKNHHDFNIEFFEAPYTEYGMGGATEVRFNSLSKDYK